MSSTTADNVASKGATWWLVTLVLLFAGSMCYVMASFYHLTMGEQWSFARAYAMALLFVSIEYIFNVVGNRRASETLTVLQIMILVFVIDFLAMFLVNAVFLKNPIYPRRDGLSIFFLFLAVVISAIGKTE